MFVSTQYFKLYKRTNPAGFVYSVSSAFGMGLYQVEEQ